VWVCGVCGGVFGLFGLCVGYRSILRKVQGGYFFVLAESAVLLHTFKV